MSLKTRAAVAVFSGLLFLLADAACLWAENARITVIMSNDEQPYQEALDGFRDYMLKQGVQAEFDVRNMKGAPSLATQAVDQKEQTGNRLVYSLGTLATASVLAKDIRIPVVSGLVPSPDRLKRAADTPGVFLEFPVETHMKMLRRFLPGTKVIGVLYSSSENRKLVEEASKIAAVNNMKIYALEVNDPRHLTAALGRMSKKVDVLWGLSDNVVLNQKTVEQFLHFSYENTIPFIGLSSTWVKAGALYALDRDYRDIGAQCGELALEILRNKGAARSAPCAPRKVLYSLNLNTARQMKIQFSEQIIRGASEIF